MIESVRAFCSDLWKILIVVCYDRQQNTSDLVSLHTQHASPPNYLYYLHRCAQPTNYLLLFLLSYLSLINQLTQIRFVCYNQKVKNEQSSTKLLSECDKPKQMHMNTNMSVCTEADKDQCCSLNKSFHSISLYLCNWVYVAIYNCELRYLCPASAQNCPW